MHIISQDMINHEAMIILGFSPIFNDIVLGFTILDQFDELYEGNIWLESEPKKGTTFYFTIKK